VDGLDGAEWIIEGKRFNQYQVVDRWTPDKNSKYYKCCDFLISLTDLEISERDKY
jgi:DNA topoisomerase IB